MKNNVKLVKLQEQSDDVEKAWREVCANYAMVFTLDKITPKAIPRSGKAMAKAIYDLMNALEVYDHMRNS